MESFAHTVPELPEQSGSRFHYNKRETIDSFMGFTRGDSLPRWPIEVFLEFSNLCDLKCAMCPTFSALSPHRFLSLRETERGFLDAKGVVAPLRTLLSHALNVHCFGYGEATLHPDFREFIKTVAEYEVLIDFFTNGMHLDESLADFLVEHRVWSVTVSFSGTTKEEYENVYLGGVYEQVLGGIAALARAKERAGSHYPTIEINSLSFEHHVQKLDRFVTLMADHGANVIHLKMLQTHAMIPELAGHGSVLRPWVEGEILIRAYQEAAARGVILSTSQYDMTAVNSEEEWRRAKANQGARRDVPHEERLVPIGKWKQNAEIVQPIRPQGTANQKGDSPSPEPLSGQPLRQAMRISPLRGSAEPFYCFEPFKTVYVRKDGTIKPCCFAYPNVTLGDVNREDGRAVWMGEAYDTVRTAILQQQYPQAMCGECLKQRIGPQHHFTHHKVEQYLRWYKHSFGIPLMRDPSQMLEDAGDNTEIALRYLEHHPGLLAGAPSGTAKQAREFKPAERTAEATGGSNSPEVIAELHEHRDAQAALESYARGHLDRFLAGRLIGWVWTPLKPDVRLWVSIFDGDDFVGTVQACRTRMDLKLAGIGDGMYGFEYLLPDNIRDGKYHSFFARIEGTEIGLRAEPLLVQVPIRPGRRNSVGDGEMDGNNSGATSG